MNNHYIKQLKPDEILFLSKKFFLNNEKIDTSMINLIYENLIKKDIHYRW